MDQSCCKHSSHRPSYLHLFLLHNAPNSEQQLCIHLITVLFDLMLSSSHARWLLTLSTVNGLKDGEFRNSYSFVIRGLCETNRRQLWAFQTLGYTSSFPFGGSMYSVQNLIVKGNSQLTIWHFNECSIPTNYDHSKSTSIAAGRISPEDH